MLSMPPATTMPASPRRIAWAAIITAFRPEPQTLLTVAAPTETGSPAPSAACRAGFWPSPAPRRSPCTLHPPPWPGCRCAQDALDAGGPQLRSRHLSHAPPIAPIGVRSPATITASPRFVFIRSLP